MTDERLLSRVLERLEPPPSKRAATSAARHTAGIPRYLAELRITRGTCRGGTKRKPCPSRHGVTRVTFDYRDRTRVDSFAHVECALCGRTWRRVKVPRLGEYQSVLLTLILPDHAKRWFARGTWHREGSDAIVRPNATWSDLMDAGAEWRERNIAYLATRSRAQERAAERDREARERMAVLLAKWADRDAEEAAAAAREAGAA